MTQINIRVSAPFPNRVKLGMIPPMREYDTKQNHFEMSKPIKMVPFLFRVLGFGFEFSK
jgi:hypothetical protein